MHLIHVVHIGAGRHSANHDSHFKNLIRLAVHSSTLTDASRVIERCTSTNTAKGSSLDSSGHASSDCSIIHVDDWKINGQCALLNIRNQRFPTQFTQSLSTWLDEQYGTDSIRKNLGLSRPIVMEYNTLKDYLEISGLNASAISQGFSSKDSLVSKKAARDFDSFSNYMDKINSDAGATLEGIATTEPVLSTQVHDTVGIVYLDKKPGHSLSVATSSGGNFFRLPGRISCAGLPGAGVAYGHHEGIEACCMCSGNGDDIIQMNLASYLCDSITLELSGCSDWPDLGELLVSGITKRGRRQAFAADVGNNPPVPYVGVIMVFRSQNGNRLVYCHSTETFYFGFRHNGATEVVLSRNHSTGKFLHGEYKL